MADVCVTVPKQLWAEWLEEGDLARSDEWAGKSPADWNGTHEYGFYMRGKPPLILPGQRVYIVAHGLLRGYAPLKYIDSGERFGGGPDSFALVRHGDAIAVTIPEPIRGFQGYRYRWWEDSQEIPFPNWMLTDG